MKFGCCFALMVFRRWLLSLTLEKEKEEKKSCERTHTGKQNICSFLC